MIRVAVIGAGHWGPNLIRNFHNRMKSEVAWVVDKDEGKLERAKAVFPEVRVSTDARDAIADPSVDAVVVATPTSTHHPLAKAALEAKKHVLVEKPIAANVEHGRELCALAEKTERVLMVGHVFLFNRGITTIKEHIDRGDLGRVYYVSMERTNLGPIRMDVNAAWDLASHDVSIANYWLNSEPVSVSATAGNWINEGIADAVFATMRYPDGVLAHLHASWLNPKKARDITIVGERCMLTFDDMNLNEPLRIYDKQVMEDRTHPMWVDTFASFRASVREGAITIPKIALGEPLKAECEHFLDCVARRKKPPHTAGEDGVAVVRILEALERSMNRGGAEVEVAS